MKVIDLLNKIANGEEFNSCKIKFTGIEPEEVNEYFIYDRLYEEDLKLNDEVEIIEESKKIEKITVREKTLGFQNGEWTARNMDKAFAIKINELIDKINNLKVEE